MAKAHYVPKIQSGLGQFIDCILVLVLVYASLYAPLFMQGKDVGSTQTSAQKPSWQSLKQNNYEAGQWQKLGYTPEQAQPIIESKFEYSISWPVLGLTALVIIGYYFFMLKVSDKEYREVIREKFGDRP
jgi:predicted PurR-regulated permease PerM